MTEQKNEEELLKEIVAHPNDDRLRQEYARILRERGDPRGEFILAQCQARRVNLPYLPPDHPARSLFGKWADSNQFEGRARQLLADNYDKWTIGIRNMGVQEVHFERGFPEHLVVDVRSFIDNADRIFLAAPTVRSLTIECGDTPPSSDLAHALADCPGLAQIESLTLGGCLQNDVLQQLAASPHLGRLRSLTILPDAGILFIGLCDLLRSSRLPRLEELDISGNPIGFLGAMSMGELTQMGPPLRRLRLQDTGIDGPAALQLAETSGLAGLEELDLFDNPLTEKGVRALVQSGNLKNVCLQIKTEAFPDGVRQSLDRILTLHNSKMAADTPGR